MSQVFSIPLSCDIPGVMKSLYGIGSPEIYFLSKYQHAVKSLTLMEKIAPDVKPSGLQFFEITKNFIVDAAVFNEARYRYFVARRLLIEGKIDEANKEIELAKKIISTRPATSKQVKELNADLIMVADLKNLKDKKDFANKRLKDRKISLGVYTPYSIYQGVVSSLDGIKSIKITNFDNPTAGELAKYNVIFFSATTDLWDMTEDWRETVKNFVKNGGTVIFSHNAVGANRQSALGRSLFPNISQEYMGKATNQRQLKVVTTHPVLSWLKKDDIIEHEYSDHLWMTPGRDGTVLLRDAGNNAVMIVGSYGKGRVIYTGQMFGYNRQNQTKSSEGDDWKLLLSMVAVTSSM